MNKIKEILKDLTTWQIVFLIILSIILSFATFILLCLGNGDYFFFLLLSSALVITILIYALKSENKSDEESNQIDLDTSTSPDVITEEKQQYIVSVRLYIKSKGGVLSFIGAAMTVSLWLILTLGSTLQEETLVTAVRSGYITNPYNLIAISALLSVFGWIFHDATCNLLAAVALIGTFLVDYTATIVFVPAILLMIAYVRMKPRFILYTETE